MGAPTHAKWIADALPARRLSKDDGEGHWTFVLVDRAAVLFAGSGWRRTMSRMDRGVTHCRWSARHVKDHRETLVKWLTTFLALSAALLLGSMVASWKVCAAEENETELAKEDAEPGGRPHADRPKDAPDWQLRFQLQFLFPK